MKQKNEIGLRDRLLKGVGAQGFTQAIQLFIRLVEVPLLLSFWNPQLYGEWLMISAIPTYLSIGGGGFAGTACREMVMRSSAGDRNGTLAVFQSMWIFLIFLSISTGFIAFGFAETAPLGDWLGFSSMNDREVKVVFLLLVGYVLVGFQGVLLNGSFWVMGRYSDSMYFIAITQFLEFAGLAGAVLLGGGPIQAASGVLSGKCLGTGLMWIGQHRSIPWLKHGFTHSSLAELRKIIPPAFASLAFPLGNTLNIQGMRIVVGMALGPSAVALFVPLRTLSRLVVQPTTIVNRLIEPELALAYGARDNSLFQRLFTRSCQLALWGCMGAFFFVGMCAHWIFPAWTGGKVAIHWPVLATLLGGGLVYSIWNTALMVPYAINQHSRIAVAYALIYGAVACGLGYLGAHSLRLNGVAFGLLLAEITMAVIVLKDALQKTGVNIAQWIELILHPPHEIFWKVALLFWKRKNFTSI